MSSVEPSRDQEPAEAVAKATVVDASATVESIVNDCGALSTEPPFA